jgi:hypothetical protein
MTFSETKTHRERDAIVVDELADCLPLDAEETSHLLGG